MPFNGMLDDGQSYVETKENCESRYTHFLQISCTILLDVYIAHLNCTPFETSICVQLGMIMSGFSTTGRAGIQE